MSSQPIIDFLTKQIFIERNIVTYRSLSRELRIHVGTAKNELATYHENAPYRSQISNATYLLCGEIASPGNSDIEMDLDTGKDVGGDYEDDGDEVYQRKILLVNERDLEAAKLQFTRLESIYIYSLAPSPLRDAGLICTPLERIRDADRGKDAKEMVQLVGKIVSSSIKVAPVITKARTTRPPVAGPSRLKPASKAEGNAANMETEEPVNPLEKPKEKAKVAGKLNFFGAKPKDKKLVPVTPEIPAEKPQEKKDKSPNLQSVPKAQLPKEASKPSKGGTKQKSALVSDSEDGASSAPSPKAILNPPTLPKGNARVRKRVLLSDDEEDETVKPKPIPKSRKKFVSVAADSDTEDVQALMDIDDDQVTRVIRGTPVRTKDSEYEEEDDKASIANEDVNMEDDIIPKPKPKKRREKKVIPVGRNGIKKRRVVKSRETVNEKGYTVYEDYSEYESVDEDDEPEPVLAKGAAKGKAKAAKVMVKEEEEESSAAATPISKPKPAAKGFAPAKSGKTSKGAAGASKTLQKQNSLANFFASKPKK